MNTNIKIYILIAFIISCKNPKKDLLNNQNKMNQPNKQLFFKNTANSLYENDQYAGAVIYYDSLIQLDSLNGEYYCKRGYSYDMIYKKQGLKVAISDYLKSIELGYKKETCYFNLGLSYMYLNDSTALFYLNKSY